MRPLTKKNDPSIQSDLTPIFPLTIPLLKLMIKK